MEIMKNNQTPMKRRGTNSSLRNALLRTSSNGDVMKSITALLSFKTKIVG